MAYSQQNFHFMNSSDYVKKEETFVSLLLFSMLHLLHLLCNPSCLIFLLNFLFIFVYLHLTFYFFCTNLCPYINIEVYIYLTCTYGDQSPYFLLLKIHCSQLFGDGAFHLPSTISKIPYQNQIVNFEFSKEMGSGF